jgi:ABC-type uncharacterized transport system auxiliary subunit
MEWFETAARKYPVQYRTTWTRTSRTRFVLEIAANLVRKEIGDVFESRTFVIRLENGDKQNPAMLMELADQTIADGL